MDNTVSLHDLIASVWQAASAIKITGPMVFKQTTNSIITFNFLLTPMSWKQNEDENICRHVNSSVTEHTVNCSIPALENVFRKWMIT